MDPRPTRPPRCRRRPSAGPAPSSPAKEAADPPGQPRRRPRPCSRAGPPGPLGSSGRYVAPSVATASTVATHSGDRGSRTATADPRRTPWSASTRAIASVRDRSSTYVDAVPPRPAGRRRPGRARPGRRTARAATSSGGRHGLPGRAPGDLRRRGQPDRRAGGPARLRPLRGPAGTDRPPARRSSRRTGPCWPPADRPRRRVQPQREDQVEAGRAALDVERARVRSRVGSGGAADELEGDLAQGVAGQVAGRGQCLDQLLERHVLMVEGTKAGPPDPTQRLHEGRIPRKVQAQHHRVDEEPDQRLQLHPAAPRGIGTQHQVTLPRVTTHQLPEPGQQRHEHRRPTTGSQPAQPRTQRPRQLEGVRGTGERLHRRPRPVPRNLGHRSPRQHPPPEPQLLLQPRTRQQLPLPQRVVRVLDRQHRQRRRPPRPERRVQRRQLGEEQPHRPAISHRMVHRHRQHMIGRTQPEHPHPHQRPHRQIERLARQRRRRRHRRPHRTPTPTSASTRQVHQRHRHPHPRITRRRDHLHRLTPHLPEPRPQRLVPRHDLVHTPPHQPHIHRKRQPQRHIDIVERCAGVQPVHEPQPLLGERQGRRPSTTRGRIGSSATVIPSAASMRSSSSARSWPKREVPLMAPMSSALWKVQGTATRKR